MKVTLYDRVTEHTAEAGDYSVFWWTEGNGSCDCNRALAFEPEVDEELEKKFGEHFCYGTERFIAIDVHGDLEGHTKEHLICIMNEEYK